MTSDFERERADAIAAGDEAWAELRAALDAADPEVALHDPDSPEWTSRDVYAHFVRMHRGSMDALRRELAGETVTFAPEDTAERIATVERRNDARALEDRALSLEEARRLAEETRVAYRALMLSLTPEQWDAFGRTHSDDLVGGHYRGHLGYLVRGG